MAKAIFFDLDGTLTDSGEGIINCVELALTHFAIPLPDRQTLREFVGPPLRDSFAKYGVPADRVDEAVAVYRARYVKDGLFENFPYPGIEELLQKLRAQGHKLYVATSKPEIQANRILTHFGLAPYFDIICGASMDGSRDKKSAVITYLLGQTGALSEVIMVGDTEFDVEGAKELGIPCIGVSWGYGDLEKMKQAGAMAIVNTMDELFEMLNK